MLSNRTPCALPAVPRRQRIIVPKNSAAGSRMTCLEGAFIDSQEGKPQQKGANELTGFWTMH